MAESDATQSDKASLKGKIRELKARRDSALEAHDSVQLARVRRKIQRLKRKIRRQSA